MVAFTDSQLLPYQEGTDDPCLSPEVWCQFTDRVDGLLVAHENVLNRTARAIPMAKVELTIPAVYVQFTDFRFDSVVVDTDNWVDLEQFPNSINITRDGWFFVLAEVQQDFVLVNSQPELLVQSGTAGSITSQQMRDLGSGIVYITSSLYTSSTAATTGVPRSLGLSYLITGSSANTTIRYASLTAYWVADLP